MKDLNVYKPLTLRPDFSRSHTPPERHALDSDDFSEQGMLRDMERRRDYDIAKMRETALDECLPNAEVTKSETEPFWRSVRELAAMRAQIPTERHQMSGVRMLMQDEPCEVAATSESPDRSDVECGCARSVTTDDLTLAQVRAVRTAMLQAQAALLGLHRDARARLRTTQHAAEILIANWTTARLENQRRLVCDVINSAACVPHK